MQITKEWLEANRACNEGMEWFNNQSQADGIVVVEKLMIENRLDWANWTIVHMLNPKQQQKYAAYAAEQVTYLWKDKYPKEYAIWKKWVDDGCPEAARDAAQAAARDAARDAARAAAWDAERAAAWAAARDAAWAAAWDAERAAAWAAAWDATRDAMLTKIIQYGIELYEEGVCK